MNTYLFSIQPKWCERIFNGEKTIEVRKTAPKPPFKVVVYCTKKGNDKLKNQLVKMDDTGELKLCSETNLSAYRLNGKVIGEFICDKVDTIVYTGASYEIKGETTAYTNQVARDSCLEFPDLRAYLGVKGGKALHITDLKIYDKPRELGEFYRLDDSGDDCCCGCIYHEIPMNEYPCCKCNGDRKYLTRPPQSYMRIQDPDDFEKLKEIKK